MYTPIEESAVLLLRERAEPIVSLHWLHGELRARGEAVGSDATHLEASLRRRPDRFMVLGPREIDVTQWPPALQRAYQEAFARARFDASPRVVLLEEPVAGIDALPSASASASPAPLAHQLRASLVALCRGLADEPGVRDALLEAIDQTHDICRALESAPRRYFILTNMGTDGADPKPDFRIRRFLRVDRQ
jgi:hypothetical protein